MHERPRGMWSEPIFRALPGRDDHVYGHSRDRSLRQTPSLGGVIVKSETKRRIAALVSGLLFGAGLAISGMVLPEKVTGFLDITGKWDPSLALVMIGAISVHVFAVRLAYRRGAPYFGGGLQLPTKKDLDPKLVLGAATFGVGWGLAGICPGPGLVNLFTGSLGAAVFVGAMLVGMWIEYWTVEAKQAKQAKQALKTVATAVLP